MPKGQKSKRAGCLYIAGAVILGIWSIGKVANMGSKNREGTAVETQTPSESFAENSDRTSISTPPVLRKNDEMATPNKPVVSIATQQLASATSAPRVRTATEIQRIQRFVPTEVTLTQPVGFPVMDRGRAVNTTNVPKGSKAQVLGMAGDKVLLDYSGRRQTVPILYTDFVNRVIAEAEK